METKNVGSFESPLRVKNELPVEIQLPKMIEICNEHNIYMKEHNAASFCVMQRKHTTQSNANFIDTVTIQGR